MNGASLRTGDLLPPGRSPVPARGARSLIELSWNGAEPIELGDGSRRSFLEDGDEVVSAASRSARCAAACAGRRGLSMDLQPMAVGARPPGDYAPSAGARALEALAWPRPSRCRAPS